MAAALINYEDRLRQAVQLFWRGRRDAAAGGENLAGFRDMIEDVVRQHGPAGCEVHRGNAACVLPGFFRPTNPWDMVIVFQDRLLAALGLKSLCGPSFENDADKCCDEAVRSGYDFRAVQRKRGQAWLIDVMLDGWSNIWQRVDYAETGGRVRAYVQVRL